MTDLTLSALISEIGGDNINMQAIDTCAVEFKKTAGYQKITFLTDEDWGMTPSGGTRTEKMGVVVWMDRDQFEQASEKIRGNEND